MDKKLRFRVVVEGNPAITDRPSVCAKLDHILGPKLKTHAITIISGCGPGPASIGYEWAIQKGIPVKAIPLNPKFGKEVQHTLMLNSADAVITFDHSILASMAKTGKKMLREVRI